MSRCTAPVAPHGPQRSAQPPGYLVSVECMWPTSMNRHQSLSFKPGGPTHIRLDVQTWRIHAFHFPPFYTGVQVYRCTGQQGNRATGVQGNRHMRLCPTPVNYGYDYVQAVPNDSALVPGIHIQTPSQVLPLAPIMWVRLASPRTCFATHTHVRANRHDFTNALMPRNPWQSWTERVLALDGVNVGRINRRLCEVWTYAGVDICGCECVGVDAGWVTDNLACEWGSVWACLL